jgi:hypothetical protein
MKFVAPSHHHYCSRGSQDVACYFCLTPFYLHLCLFEEKNGFDIFAKFGSFAN